MILGTVTVHDRPGCSRLASKANFSVFMVVRRVSKDLARLRLREMTLSLCSALVKPNVCPVWGLTVQGRHWHSRAGPAEPMKMSGTAALRTEQ